MSSSEKSKGRKSRRVAAQQNASGKEGIPAKKEMTVEELKRYGIVYLEGGQLGLCVRHTATGHSRDEPAHVS